MGWEQWIIAVILFSNFGVAAAKYGEEKLDPTYTWISIISPWIWFVLLYLGEFFNA